MSGKPMDPERLAALEWAQNSSDNDGRRWLAEELRGAGMEAYAAACVLADLGPRGDETTRIDREGAVRVLVTELSKACARAKRWRSQCPVTAEHVEAAGVSRVLAERWLHLAGVEPYDLMGHSTLWRDAGTLTHACTTSGSAADIAAAISMLADDDPERCAHDILDEMAAAACPDCQGRCEGTVYERGDGGFSTPQDEPCPTCKGTGRATATPGGDQ